GGHRGGGVTGVGRVGAPDRVHPQLGGELEEPVALRGAEGAVLGQAHGWGSTPAAGGQTLCLVGREVAARGVAAAAGVAREAAAWSSRSCRRSAARVRASNRDTCIWEMPTRRAIWSWLRLPKNRRTRMRRSRSGKAATAGTTV